MTDYGMKISKDGDDVTTAADKDLVMTSKFNQFKIFAQGSFTVTVAKNTAYGYTDLIHNLGYVPGFLIYLENVADSGKRYIVNSRGTNSLSASADTSKIRALVTYPFAGTFATDKTHDGYYFIFVDEL
jgi:hypothetical protein